MSAPTNQRLTKKERVLRTFRFEETDRVPVYDLLQNDSLIRYAASGFLSGQELTPENGLEAKGYAIEQFFDMTRSPEGPTAPCDVSWENGIKLRQERWTSWIVHYPFADAEQAKDWIKSQIVHTNSLVYTKDYGERFHTWMDLIASLNSKNNHDPAVQVIESGVGFTEIYWYLGWEIFSELSVESPELIDEWLDARHRAELRRVDAIADPRYIPVALTYDDIAYKAGLLISPNWLRRYWVPRLEKLVAAWHNRDVYCLFHSDGSLWKILPDLVKAGIDGLNPLEILAGMDIAAVRAAYPHLVLTGGIDVSQLLSLGTPEQIAQTCREAINATAGRGYFLGSTTELHWEIPLPNLLAMLAKPWVI